MLSVHWIVYAGLNCCRHHDELRLSEEQRLRWRRNRGLREWARGEGAQDHGAAKGTGPDDDVCVLVTAVANGGFCWLRWLVKKLGLSNIKARAGADHRFAVAARDRTRRRSWARTASRSSW